MIKTKEIELRDQVALLQGRLLENGRMLGLANARNAMLEKACRAAGAELRELQAEASKREVAKLAVCWAGLWVLAGVLTWVAS